LHIDRRQGQAAIEAAFAELELVEQLMSIYRPQSQVSRLNRDGELKSPHPYFVEVLRTAREMSAKSDGAFDITVQPLWAVFDEAKKSGTLPTEAAIAQARAKVDWRRVEISDTRVRLGKEGMAITLNGIAQGFAADKATAALRAHGVEHALIDTGEIGTLGLKENGDAWTVGIQHPRHPDAYISLAKLAGRSLATSGDYATTFSDDFRHHHLFNPRSGYSPHELASVSIAAPSAMLADALSTAVFVLGPERGLKLAASYPQTDLLLMLKNGRTLKTENFPLQV
jgi:thiamine biosynthesis lipoprotein